MKYQTAILALFSLVFGISSLFAEETRWDLKKSKDGIQVHTREVKGAAVEEFKGVTVTKTSLESVLFLFENVERVPEWLHKCKEFKLIKEKSPTEKLVYFRQDLGWPVADRDEVAHRIRSEDPITKAVSFNLKEYPGLYPEQDDVVRMPYFKALWRFTPTSDGSTEIHYQLHADPGGHIPKWLVNRLTTDLPFSTLKKFRSLLEKKSA